MSTAGNGDRPQVQRAGFMRRNRIALMVAGPLLIVIGVLLVTGLWNELMIQLKTSVPADAGVQV